MPSTYTGCFFSCPLPPPPCESQGAIGRDWKEQFVKSSNFLRIPSSRSSMEICEAGWQERGTKNEIFWHITSPSTSQPLISTALLCHSYKFNTRVARDEKYKQDLININAVQQQHWQITGWISKTQIQRYELATGIVANTKQTTDNLLRVQSCQAVAF